MTTIWDVWDRLGLMADLSPRVIISPFLSDSFKHYNYVEKYHLRPKVSASRVSVASRVVNPRHDELRPALGKELYQLHRKILVYKMSNNWKVFTQFYCNLLYTQLYAHVQNCE